METTHSSLKGLHPGIVLERELRQRKLNKGPFALSIGEYPQTLGAVTKGKRNMNTALAMKIEDALGMEEGYFMTLQVFYDIRQEKRKQNKDNHPDLTLFRPALFWDTSFEKIDWQQQRRSVIQRVFERGNETEQQEVLRFYGREIVDQELKKLNTKQQHI
jgi:antitoxin HigA-1